MDDIVKDFLIESNENLDRLDQELVRLESDPSSKELLSSIFRTIHTMKGSCGFLGFARLGKLAHAGENLLARLRDGEVTFTAEVASGLLAMVDVVRLMLAAIERTEKDGDEDYAALIEQLAALQKPAVPSPPKTISSATQESPTFVMASSYPEVPSTHLENEQPQTRHAAETETIRVGVDLLDRLMNLVGELVLARNQLLQFTNTGEEAELHAVSQRLNLITTELQGEVLKTRMQPIGNAWHKFPRLVRDLAVHCAKEVRLEMQGQDTELDRTMLEAIRDPMTHLVRNAIDHGIECPEERRNGGKLSCGLLRLRAYHADGQVNVEVSDDGAGLNRERIAKKAVEQGLVSAAQAAGMPDRDLFNLIFLPGFSTAEKVTAVSGRGVGMDVVRTGVERVGGTVEVHSNSGQGTNIGIRIPLTLAIIPALMVRAGGERFAIPQVSLRELVRYDPRTGCAGVGMVHSIPVYRLRGRLLPLISLSTELGLEAPKKGPDGPLNIVVVRAEGREFGVIVDDIIDTLEIVVKPPGKQLQGVRVFSGATILGDGRVALILDISGVARRARICAGTGAAAAPEPVTTEHAETLPGPRRSLLLVECRNHGRLAIPLPLVARLEELSAASVERIQGREVVQYRGGILPLIRLPQMTSQVPVASPASDGVLQVVVCSDSGQTVGIIVDRILDIVSEGLTPPTHSPSSYPGLSIIQEQVTELPDVSRLLRDMCDDSLAGGT